MMPETSNTKLLEKILDVLLSEKQVEVTVKPEVTVKTEVKVQQTILSTSTESIFLIFWVF